jgi:hypothetical protein
MDAQAGRSESSHGRIVNLDIMLEGGMLAVVV